MANFYEIFIIIAFLFFTGCLLGWVIEFFFRKFFSSENPEHVWQNPGFLTGPWLPLYGFGAVVLYVLSLAEAWLLGLDKGGVAHYVIMFVVMSLFMTLLEYLAGFFFLKTMHIRLWDYSDLWGNVQGLICPLFTAFWGILSAFYYFVLFPQFQTLVGWFIAHPWFSFTVGTLFGLFIVDCCVAFHLGATIRKQAQKIDNKATVNFQFLQNKLHNKHLSVHSSISLERIVDNFGDFIKRSPASSEAK